VAEVKVHESNLQKLSLGLPARITVDALPGRVFTGQIIKIAPLPDAASLWQNPDLKVFNTLIQITDDGSTMRTGMTCQAEIIAAQYNDTLYVPVQAVTRIGVQATVYVKHGNRAEARPVEIGLDNNRMVRITNGLTAGEEVLLCPPFTPAARGSESSTAAASGGAAAPPGKGSAPSPEKGARLADAPVATAPAIAAAGTPEAREAPPGPREGGRKRSDGISSGDREKGRGQSRKRSEDKGNAEPGPGP